MAELVECPHCDGYGEWLPAGACGGCDLCPKPTRCSSCDGTGRVYVADLEPDEEDEAETATRTAAKGGQSK